MPVALRAFHWHPVLSTKKMAFIAARLSTRLRCRPSGWLVLCSGSNGSIFAQSSSLISQLSSAIRPSEIVTQHYFYLTTPFGIGSKSYPCRIVRAILPQGAIEAKKAAPSPAIAALSDPPPRRWHGHNKKRAIARLRAGSCDLTTICPNEPKRPLSWGDRGHPPRRGATGPTLPIVPPRQPRYDGIT
jgi:hypothetical protein